MDHLEARIQAAQQNPQNLGEMADADSVGTVGSPDCGDMLRMWVKFKDQGGKKVIDRATFQTFGCQTAIAVASVATEMIAGKTVDEALALSGEELAAPLGALPPMKIHCAQLVEGALRSALAPSENTLSVRSATTPPLPVADTPAPTLYDSLTGGSPTHRRQKAPGRPHGQSRRQRLVFRPSIPQPATPRSGTATCNPPCTKTPKLPSAATWRPSRSPPALSSPCPPG